AAGSTANAVAVSRPTASSTSSSHCGMPPTGLMTPAAGRRDLASREAFAPLVTAAPLGGAVPPADDVPFAVGTWGAAAVGALPGACAAGWRGGAAWCLRPAAGLTWGLWPRAVAPD